MIDRMDYFLMYLFVCDKNGFPSSKFQCNQQFRLRKNNYGGDVHKSLRYQYVKYLFNFSVPKEPLRAVSKSFNN